jgi:hypothetical protein
MSTEVPFKTAVCTDYEKLLVTCKNALDRWRKRREEVLAAGLSGDKVANELLRLQADYAKAYSRLERHEHECGLCQFVSKIGGRDYSSISTAALERKRW